MKQANDGNLTGADNIANAKADLEKWRTYLKTYYFTLM